MAEYRLTPRADSDLREIWRTIAPHNESAADALLMRIFDRLALAAGQPRMGVARPEIAEHVRMLVEGNYMILYEPTDYGVLAVAIVHGMRDPANWLE